MSKGSHVEMPLAAKQISQAYKDGWDHIWGKNKKDKKEVEEKSVKKAASKILKDKSKKAKIECDEALSQKPKKSKKHKTPPTWGEPTIVMEYIDFIGRHSTP